MQKLFVIFLVLLGSLSARGETPTPTPAPCVSLNVGDLYDDAYEFYDLLLNSPETAAYAGLIFPDGQRPREGHPDSSTLTLSFAFLGKVVAIQNVTSGEPGKFAMTITYNCQTGGPIGAYWDMVRIEVNGGGAIWTEGYNGVVFGTMKLKSLLAIKLPKVENSISLNAQGSCNRIWKPSQGSYTSPYYRSGPCKRFYNNIVGLDAVKTNLINRKIESITELNVFDVNIPVRFIGGQIARGVGEVNNGLATAQFIKLSTETKAPSVIYFLGTGIQRAEPESTPVFTQTKVASISSDLPNYSYIFAGSTKEWSAPGNTNALQSSNSSLSGKVSRTGSWFEWNGNVTDIFYSRFSLWNQGAFSTRSASHVSCTTATTAVKRELTSSIKAVYGNFTSLTENNVMNPVPVGPIPTSISSRFPGTNPCP